jgi:hypothetical protein
MSLQANSQFWGTGTDLTMFRNNVMTPIEARQMIEGLGRRLFGDQYDYSEVEFRGLNLPVTIIDTTTSERITVTPYWHLMTEDGRGNRI